MKKRLCISGMLVFLMLLSVTLVFARRNSSSDERPVSNRRLNTPGGSRSPTRWKVAMDIPDSFRTARRRSPSTMSFRGRTVPEKSGGTEGKRSKY